VTSRASSELDRARAACRHAVRVELAGARVSFASDSARGVRIVQAIFGPYCEVEAGPAEGWRVLSAKVGDLPRLAERLMAGAPPPRPVRRWAGDFPADRYDLAPGRSVVVHSQPFAGLTLFDRDERELVYLRPGAAYEVPHTEHVVKYPLRVALRQAGFAQVHAAACSFEGRGLLLLGPRRSGKSTLLFRLLSRGGRFVASDMSFVKGRRAIAFPHMLRIGSGTIGDNEELSAFFVAHGRTGDYLRSPIFNAGKEELYVPVLQRIWGKDVVCRESPFDVVVFPALDLTRSTAEVVPVPAEETRRRVRETLVDDPPTLDWLPFMGDAEFEALGRRLADDVARSVPAGFELRFGARETDPVAALQELLASDERSLAPC
jgi:hypothetical protein